MTRRDYQAEHADARAELADALQAHLRLLGEMRERLKASGERVAEAKRRFTAAAAHERTSTTQS